MNIFKLNTPLLFLFLFGIFFNLSFSQNNESSFCGTAIDKEKIDYFNSFNTQVKAYKNSFYSKSSKSSKSNVEILTNSIPVKIHIIRASNGSGGLSISSLNDIIAKLNDLYTNAFLEFYISGEINYIDNDAFCHLNRQDESQITKGNNVENIINIYFTDYLENSSNNSICGYADTIGKSDIILIRNDCAMNGSSLAHEIGHVFSLMHTHGPDGDKITTELVDGSNCDTDGDGICDTPADPKLSYKTVDSDCNYTGTEVDANGHLYTPDTGNIMSYSTKSCRTHFSHEQMARMFAFYKVAKNYYSSDSFNADFNVDINETCENSLVVNFESICEDVDQWEWDINGDNIIDYTTKNPSHTFEKGVYNVSLTVSNKTRKISKTYFNYIKVGTLKSSPFNEGFESFETAGDQGWTINSSSESPYSWLINSGETPTEGTGPKHDFNIGTSKGNYIYAESSNAIEGDVTELVSPCIEINQSNLQFEFSYHMFGENIGELHVDIQTDEGFQNDVIPTLKGQIQLNAEDDYLTKTIDLSEYNGQTIKIRFRAIRGKAWDSDIAIDNIVLKENPVKTVQSTTLQVKAYPNPIKDNTLYIKSNNNGGLIGSTYYRVSNLVGQIFMEGTLINNQINLAKLNKGSYILMLQNGSSTVLKKIIK